MGILVLTTGGTIGAMPYKDVHKPPQMSEMPPAGQDMVANAVAGFGLPGLRCEKLEPRDSKLIDTAYRQNIASLIEAAPESEILITHGTDTILQTADFFYQQGLAGKKIILTGAMVPIANGPESDGYLNLAFALAMLDQPAALPAVGIVLCDFDAHHKWLPRLYPYQPDRYQKIYADDGRYSRLMERTN